MEELIMLYAYTGIKIMGYIFLMRLMFDIVIDAFRGY